MNKHAMMANIARSSANILRFVNHLIKTNARISHILTQIRNSALGYHTNQCGSNLQFWLGRLQTCWNPTLYYSMHKLYFRIFNLLVLQVLIDF